MSLGSNWQTRRTEAGRRKVAEVTSVKRIAIIGAGGYAREVAWLLEDISAATAQEASRYDMVGFLVSDASRKGPYDSPVLGDFSWLESNHVDALVIGIGYPAVRLKLAKELKERFPHIAWPALVHPSVMWQRRTTQVGEGVVICAGSIATVNVRFDPFCIINVSCTIGHEAVIGSGCVLNPTVNISGGVELGPGVLVGVGAQILQYVKVGEGARIGAGAVVNKNVNADTTVVGIPAKELAGRSPIAAVAATGSSAA
jgi:sugar O-acyltransferase (sialic acid O-acetyltransferase NeuD family)